MIFMKFCNKGFVAAGIISLLCIAMNAQMIVPRLKVPIDRVVAPPAVQQMPQARVPLNGAPYIKASQNPVTIPPGQATGTTTLTWDGGPEHKYAEIWLQLDGGMESFIVEQGQGTREFAIGAGRTYVFKLSDAGVLLASVTITTKIGSSGQGGSGGIATRPIPGNSHIAHFTDVSATPRSTGVAITFWAAYNASPMVELGTARPVQSNGRFVFPAGQAVGSGSADASRFKKVGIKPNTLHKFDSLMPDFPALRDDTAYWYIITGQDPGGPAGFVQTTGSFTTPTQAIGVKIVFESIKILDDSDDLSAGDIRYWMWVNHGTATSKGWASERGSMFTDSTYTIGQEFLILNAPKSLTISISANDEDIGLLGRFEVGGTPTPIQGWFNNKDDYDGNVAREDWDLTRFPTARNETYRHVFKLRSRDGGKLQFEVSGYWEIGRGN